MDIILTHKSPDADALACLLGGYLLFPQALPIQPEGASYPKELLSHYATVLPLRSIEDIEWEEVERAILVDVSSLRRVGKAGEEIKRRGIPLVIIDHHLLEIEGESNVERTWIKPFGSATSIIVQGIRERKIPLTPWQATLLALGIYSDTGYLTYDSTTEEDAQALAYLLSCGANTSFISFCLRIPLSQEERELLSDLTNSLRYHEVKGVRVGIASLNKDVLSFNLAPLASMILETEDIDALFLLVEVGNKTYIVARSKGEVFEVGEIVSKMGGGGHKRAASGVVHQPLKETLDLLQSLLPQGVKWDITAEDIMSFPVKFARPSHSIKRALETMKAFGFGGLPIVEGKKILGIISLQEAEKCVRYGLGDHLLKSLSFREPLIVHPHTPLPLLLRRMNERSLERALVIDRDKVIGIITKQDILTALHGYQSKGAKHEEMLKDLPLFLRDILLKIGRIASNKGMRSYLVGGVVRDILLGREITDLDIVVEGDAITLAKELAEELKGEIVFHNRFGTATLYIPQGMEIDFATARREFYSDIAVLPVVEPASLREDLFRRDFTINALALSLNPLDFGLLIDYFGGKEDLQQKKIRVMHSLSFWEDPTRILRGIRLEAKLGFKMDNWTEKLARQAVEGSVFQRLSGERIREELKLMLQENPRYCLYRMSELNIPPTIHPSLSLNKKSLNALLRVNTEGLDSELEKWLLFLYPLVEGLPGRELLQVAHRLNLTSSQREKLLYIEESIPVMEALSRQRMKRSDIYEALQGLPLETILWIKAKGGRNIRRRVTLFLRELRHISLSITGEDLLKLGAPAGPGIGKALKVVLRAKINGKIKTKEEEIELALREVRKWQTGSST